MPYDDDYAPLPTTKKDNLKSVSSQKSIFDNIPKKPSKEELDNKVKNIQDRAVDYKSRTADLAIQFKKTMDDKTLPTNKSSYAVDMERELLSNIIILASEINNDENEGEGMGSLSWIAQLFKQCLAQRDRMNKMEYALFVLEKKIQGTSPIIKQNNDKP